MPINLLGSLGYKPHPLDHVEYPSIPPVSEGLRRPFWSVMIPTYNRPDYLRRTLESVLAQDPGPETMQIEVIDNCSTVGEIKALVQELGQGRVEYFRQAQNVNFIDNWNACIEQARGHWVHMLHDDDIVLPGFYDAYRRHIEAHDCALLTSQAIIIDEQEQWLGIEGMLPPQDDGIMRHALEEIVQHNIFIAPTIVFPRDVCTRVGGFHQKLYYTCDWELWVRLATTGAVGYLPRPYSLYRRHSRTETQKDHIDGLNINSCLLTTDIMLSYIVDPALSVKAHTGAYRDYSGKCRVISRQLISNRFHRAALRQAVAGFRFWPSFEMARNIVFIAFISLRLRVFDLFPDRLKSILRALKRSAWKSSVMV
jgi:glycosyltransferase involved in cell wall biosynthesis